MGPAQQAHRHIHRHPAGQRSGCLSVRMGCLVLKGNEKLIFVEFEDISHGSFI